ncbi:MAG TPA: DUF2141 domain-containing protein [Polyangiaceae bacterium]|nr:DUF2141 domain-containing protein [Polyangiaceae bacterium]
MFTRSIALALLVTFATLAPRAEAEEPASVLEFGTSTRNGEGVVRCGLFTENGWLKSPVQAAVASIRGRTARCVFKGVAKGVYGISAFHDENKNGKLDTNFIGLPTEDYCASRDARGSFGPPSFADAKFSYAGGSMRLSARMK